MFAKRSKLSLKTVYNIVKRNYTPPTLEQVGKSQNKNLRLVLLGAPGSGKGSFSKFISHHFDVPMISTGDLIRSEISSKSEIGLKVEDIIKKGHLVSDDIVIDMLKTRLAQPDTKQGYILDGFPRRAAQAEVLSQLSTSEDALVQPPNTVVNIELREDIIVTKACARRVCSGCGQGYNLADVHDGEICMPAILPKVEGKCDSCGEGLYQRTDDVEDTVRERLRVYHENANPLMDYYNQQGILLNWTVIRGLEDTSVLLKMIDDSLAKKQHI